MYLPDFLDGFDRLVAFDAETTGKRTPDAEFVRKQPFAWRAPGIIIEVGFVEMLEKAGLGARARCGAPGSTGWPDRPRGHQDPQDSARRSQERSTVPDDPAESERLRWRLADRGPRLQGQTYAMQPSVTRSLARPSLGTRTSPRRRGSAAAA
jgi:hypothetical protein